MKEKFDLYQELQKNGFEKKEMSFGHALEKNYSKESKVAFYGNVISTYRVVAIFSENKSCVTVNYFIGGSSKADKSKTHLNEKRALNAIRTTVENHGFEF